MKLILITLIFTLLAISGRGQENRLKKRIIDPQYTWRTIATGQLENFYFNLQPVQTTEFKSHFRISLNGQVIDFYSSDNITFQGKLTNYTIEYVTLKDKHSDYDNSKEYQYVFEQIDLEPLGVYEMIERLIKSRQSDIPTDSLITFWNHRFFHCNSVVFQINTNGEYVNQSFHCPWSQSDSIEFKNTIVANYQALKSIFKLDSIYNRFEDKLPKGTSYSRDGYIMMYKMTDQQFQNWRKGQPQRDYMKSVKDTIDKYINSELNRLNIKLNDIDCFEDYELTFNKKGDLQNVSVRKDEKPTLRNSLDLKGYLAGKKEIRKCKRKIKQIFKEIDLSFVNLEYEFYRIFSFGNKGNFQLRDETIY